MWNVNFVSLVIVQDSSNLADLCVHCQGVRRTVHFVIFYTVISDSVIICGITQLTFPMNIYFTVIYFDAQVTPQRS